MMGFYFKMILMIVTYTLLWFLFLRKYFITPESVREAKRKMRGWF